MTLTYRGSTIAEAMKDFVELNKGALGIEAVYYGDQRQIPTVPAVCIEPAVTDRTLEGAPYITMNEFVVILLVYHTSLQGTEIIQKECDAVSDALADAINKESTGQSGGEKFGNIVTAGHVSRQEYGYRILGDELMRCNRLTWAGRTKTFLVA